MRFAPTTQRVAAGLQFDRDGFQILPNIISFAEGNLLADELTALFQERQKTAASKVGGLRNLFQLSSRVAEFATSARIISLLENITGRPVFRVRSIFFDKTAESNWRVPWHQDLTIAVADRIDTEGFTGWSVKEEILHVQPPVEILEGMVTLRLHLDDCDASNGALKVIPGSHIRGKLPPAEISIWAQAEMATVCQIARGGAMVMRPLLLHASAPAVTPSHRRVLHIEYATQALPNGLRWFDA